MFAIGGSTYYLIRAYYGHAYAYVPTALQLQQWKDSLIGHNKKYGIAETADQTEEKVLSDLYDRFAFCADSNALTNDHKSKMLYAANFWMIVAIVIAFAAGFVSVVVSIPKEDKVYKVRTM